MFCVLRPILWAIVLLAGQLSWAGVLRAGEQNSRPAPQKVREPHFETWFGATASQESWAAYTGTTLSPFGAITSEGWRLRYVGGYGAYKYGRDTKAGTLTYDAIYAFSDFLIGYQKQLGELTAKAFAGPTAITHTIRPPDPEFQDRSEYGVKGALELWFNLSDAMFLKSDLAAAYYFDNAERFHDVSLRAAAGLRMGSNLRIGAEGGFMTQRSYDSYEAGLFAGYQWHGLDLTLAGGAIAEESDIGAYVRGSLFVRY